MASGPTRGSDMRGRMGAAVELLGEWGCQRGTRNILCLLPNQCSQLKLRPPLLADTMLLLTARHMRESYDGGAHV